MRTNTFTAVVAMCLLANSAASWAQDAFTRQKREAANPTERLGDLPLGAVIRTDERYNNGMLFRGPRGWAYWNYLANPQGYQNPNLWPDKRPTYLFGEMSIPAGAELTVHGRFPHVRFFNFSIYRFERNTFVNATGGSIDGYDMEPDPGSTNPYRVGADRDSKNRNFTIHVIAKDPPTNPADRVKNSVYLGNADQTIFGGFRMYVSDRGYDGAGWGPGDGPSHEGPGITYEATLADGTKLSEAEANQRFGKMMGDAPPPINADDWYKLVNSPANDPCMTPATAPACPNSQFFLFTGIKDALYGAFMPPAERATIAKPASSDGGANASTAYLVNYISRAYGPLYVFRAKMPTFPDTWANTKIMPDGEVKYWSVATMATLTSGSLWDGVFDMQVPVDRDGFYTIVVSRPEDRPKNATASNGITWIDWGPGEGLSDPRNRKDWGALLMRFMVPQKDWTYNPLQPGDLATIMGPYYPRGYYTTKEEFEAKGAHGTAATPSGAAELKKVTVDGTRDMRFGEILVVKPTGVLVYNTTGTNDCPAALWDAMDIEAIKRQFGAEAVQKNGPHYWMMDSQTLWLGETASFGGLEARYAATLDPAIVQKSASGSQPYTVFEPKKVQRMVYQKGKPVFELVDPEGHVYVLQAHDERFPIESLATLGRQMKQLPQGWHYRSRTLTTDLVLDLGPTQTIYAVGDEFHQYYTRIPKGD